ncbi:hypothetical protein Q5P01_018133 [Channa striata]|uniref:Uncharacterized protein n=1 Tax=Channa striata TaxID=64152 RepID=A0AA88M6L0_CHASR|nr:hypothetical protein Q5P01_018133 [Channa striata]
MGGDVSRYCQAPLSRKSFSLRGTVWRLFSVNTQQRAWKNPTTTINHSGRTWTSSHSHTSLCLLKLQRLKTGTEADQLSSCDQDYLAQRDRPLETNTKLPFATAPELFPDPDRGIYSLAGRYFAFKYKKKMEKKDPQMRS